MKTVFLFLLITLGFYIKGLSQSANHERIPVIGEMAPSFTAESTHGKITFPDDFYGKWKILFTCFADFTPVCATELIELANMQEEWLKLDTRIVVMLTDGIPSHVTWVNSMQNIKYKEKNVPHINFPLISDHTLEASRKYGIVDHGHHEVRILRSVFIIDQNDRVRTVFLYPQNVGCNLEEIRRILIALQLSDQRNVLIPANWVPGDAVLIPSPKTEVDAERMSEIKDPDLQRVEWYMWLKKMK